MDNQNLREPVSHGTVSFPLATYTWNGSFPLNTPAHWHSETEILLFSRGTFILTVNMQQMKVHSPAAAFISSGEVHAVASLDETGTKIQPVKQQEHIPHAVSRANNTQSGTCPVVNPTMETLPNKTSAALPSFGTAESAGVFPPDTQAPAEVSVSTLSATAAGSTPASDTAANRSRQHPPLEQAVVFNLEMLNFQHYDEPQASLLTPLAESRLQLPRLVTPQSPGWNELYLLLSGIFSTAEQSTAAAHLKIKAALLDCIALLHENHLLQGSIPKNSPYRIACIKQILTYIHTHYAEKITLEQIAGAARLNNQYVCRFFKKATGRTLTEYINIVRIEKAAEALSQTDSKIIDIAVDCGYNNMSHFIRNFSRIKGMSPLQFRKSQNSIINSAF